MNHQDIRVLQTEHQTKYISASKQKSDWNKNLVIPENTFLLLSQADLTSWHSGTGNSIQEIRLSIIPVAGNEKENTQKK